MEIVKSSTRKGQTIIDKICNARKNLGMLPSLRTCYNTCSMLKLHAYNGCKNELYKVMADLNSNSNNVMYEIWDEGIVLYNTSVFTYGAIIGLVDKKTFEEVGVNYLYITPSYVYMVE